MDTLTVEAHDADFWPRYRVRHDLRARRIGHPFTFAGHCYRDGYVVRDSTGALLVVTVTEFEAIYELAGRDD